MVIGNLGTDAHIRKNQAGSEFTSFSVASTRKFKNSLGETIEETSWVSVVVTWDTSRLRPYLIKGTKVFVMGRLRTRIFTTKAGEQAVGVECVADELELCGSRLPDTNQQLPEDERPF